jgi:hypothetical protein
MQSRKDFFKGQGTGIVVEIRCFIKSGLKLRSCI